MTTSEDLLFQYLKDILYHPNHKELNLQDVEVKWQKLAQGLQFLDACVKENREFAKAMAKGDLSCTPPGVDNMLAAPMKELQNALRHLTWQTQEIAKGDYSQKVDFMGEFSDSFNMMTQQLKERQEALLAEKAVIEQKNQELERNLELVMALTNFTHNMIFVYSIKEDDLLFANEAAHWFLKTKPQTAHQVLDNLHHKKIDSTASPTMWEIEIPSDHESIGSEYFVIEAYHFSWKERASMVYVLIDDTERKKKENLMYKLAYVDPLTGLNNRRFAMTQMEQYMKENIPFVMSFIDIDYLKYCNDTFGHKTGDEYLMIISNALKSLGGDVCRIGGDEFIIVQTRIQAKTQDERLEQLRQLLLEDSRSQIYPMSFSYASCDIPAHAQDTLEDYIKRTDTHMYQYKMKHKLPLKDVVYRDHRL